MRNEHSETAIAKEDDSSSLAPFALGFCCGLCVALGAAVMMAFSIGNYDEKQNLRCQVMYGQSAVMIRPYNKPISCTEDIKNLPEDYRP